MARNATIFFVRIKPPQTVFRKYKKLTFLISNRWVDFYKEIISNQYPIQLAHVGSVIFSSV